MIPPGNNQNKFYYSCPTCTLKASVQLQTTTAAARKVTAELSPTADQSPKWGKAVGPEAKMAGSPTIDVSQFVNTESQHHLPVTRGGDLISRAIKVQVNCRPYILLNYHVWQYKADKVGGVDIPPIENALRFENTDLCVLSMQHDMFPGVKVTRLGVLDEKYQGRVTMSVPRGKSLHMAVCDSVWHDIKSPQQINFNHKTSTQPGDCGSRVLTPENVVIGIHSGTHGEQIANYFLGFTQKVHDWLNASC